MKDRMVISISSKRFSWNSMYVSRAVPEPITEAFIMEFIQALYDTRDRLEKTEIEREIKEAEDRKLAEAKEELYKVVQEICKYEKSCTYMGRGGYFGWDSIFGYFCARRVYTGWGRTRQGTGKCRCIRITPKGNLSRVPIYGLNSFQKVVLGKRFLEIANKIKEFYIYGKAQKQKEEEANKATTPAVC